MRGYLSARQCALALSLLSLFMIAETVRATVLTDFAIFVPIGDGECDGACEAFAIEPLTPPTSFDFERESVGAVEFTFGAAVERFAPDRDTFRRILNDGTGDIELDVEEGGFLFRLRFGDTFFDESDILEDVIVVNLGDDDAGISSPFVAINDEGAKLSWSRSHYFEVMRGDATADCAFCTFSEWGGWKVLPVPEPAPLVLMTGALLGFIRFRAFMGAVA